MRKLFVAGNWKMHKTVGEAVELVNGLKARVGDVTAVDVAVCPPAMALQAVIEAAKGSNIQVGAQNCHWLEQGACTGEIAPGMLADLGCQWVIVGHSERRHDFNEPDIWLNQKVKAGLKAGLKVMFCIGETLPEREGGWMDVVLEGQVMGGLAGLSEGQLDSVVLAYEPVWAIGTGVTATEGQAQEAHVFVRGVVKKYFGAAAAEKMRIQYGGSVKPGNAAGLLGQADVDGALVGGASLKADSFAEIITAVAG